MNLNYEEEFKEFIDGKFILKCEKVKDNETN